MNKILKQIAVKLRYPKLLLLIASIFLGYLIYKDGNNFYFHDTLETLGYLGTFLAGMMFAHGFTLGPAVAILLINAGNQNLITAGIIAGLGAILGNVLIYKSMRVSYDEEIHNISKHPLYQWLTEQTDRITPRFVKSYLFPVFAGMISATPLPDEFSATLIHASRGMSFTIFSAVTFFFNVFGIFIILLIGKML